MIVDQLTWSIELNENVFSRVKGNRVEVGFVKLNNGAGWLLDESSRTALSVYKSEKGVECDCYVQLISVFIIISKTRSFL